MPVFEKQLKVWLLNATAPMRRSPKTTVAYILWSATGAERLVITLGLVAICMAFVEVSIFRLVGMLIDGNRGQGVSAFLEDNVATLIGLALLVGVVTPALIHLQSTLSSIIAGPQLFYQALLRSHQHMLECPVALFDQVAAGVISQKQLQAASSLATIMSLALNTIGPLSAFAFAMTVALASAHGVLGLVVLFWIGAYALTLRWLLPAIRAASTKRAGERANLSGGLVDICANMRLVKQYNHRGQELTHFSYQLDEWRIAAERYGRSVTRLRTALAVLNGAGVIAMIGAAITLELAIASSLGIVAVTSAMALRFTALLNVAAFNLLTLFAEWGAIDNALSVIGVDRDSQSGGRLCESESTDNEAVQCHGQARTISQVAVSIEARA